jgi:hypothetical protein
MYLSGTRDSADKSWKSVSFLIPSKSPNVNRASYSLLAFLKLATKGRVATATTAETANTNPSKPALTPKENTFAYKTGATV